MCTPTTRVPSSRVSQCNASSRSRAVGGSIDTTRTFVTRRAARSSGGMDHRVPSAPRASESGGARQRVGKIVGAEDAYRRRAPPLRLELAAARRRGAPRRPHVGGGPTHDARAHRARRSAIPRERVASAAHAGKRRRHLHGHRSRPRGAAEAGESDRRARRDARTRTRTRTRGRCTWGDTRAPGGVSVGVGEIEVADDDVALGRRLADGEHRPVGRRDAPPGPPLPSPRRGTRGRGRTRTENQNRIPGRVLSRAVVVRVDGETGDAASGEADVWCLVSGPLSAPMDASHGGEGGTVLAVVLVLDGAPVMIVARIVRVGLIAIPPRWTAPPSPSPSRSPRRGSTGVVVAGDGLDAAGRPARRRGSVLIVEEDEAMGSTAMTTRSPSMVLFWAGKPSSLTSWGTPSGDVRLPAAVGIDANLPDVELAA